MIELPARGTWRTRSLVFAVSAALLFCSFSFNFLHVADAAWFASFNCQLEDQVAARLAKSRRDGFFSAGGLNGTVDRPGLTAHLYDPTLIQFQNDVYLHDAPFTGYKPYLSQIGGQSMLYRLVEMALPLPAEARFDVLHKLASALTAMTLALIVLWFYLEFGGWAGLAALASLLASRWMTVFGAQLWWATWSYYIPMVTMMYFLRRRQPATRRAYGSLALFVLAAVFAKCVLTGYEYITTTLMMLLVPWVYYSVRRRVTAGTFVRGMAVTGGAALAGVVLTMVILCAQVAGVRGHFSAGIDHLAYSVRKRTYADPAAFPEVYRGVHVLTAMGVLRLYLAGDFVDLNRCVPGAGPFVRDNVLRVRYVYLIVLFGVASLLLLRHHRRRPGEESRRDVALIVAAWFSLLAPLSWFVIFKSHSEIHAHLNYIVWQMPLTIFGFGVCGRVVAVYARHRAEEAEGAKEDWALEGGTRALPR